MPRPFQTVLMIFTLIVASVCVVLARAPNSTVVRYDDVPDGAYAVVADIRATRGKERELREATLALVAQVRAEPNNLLYFLHEDRETPGHFVFYEVFVTKADFEAHNATRHVQAWVEKLQELADGDVKVVRMEILGNRTSARH